jgi:hypothetical protein
LPPFFFLLALPLAGSQRALVTLAGQFAFGLEQFDLLAEGLDLALQFTIWVFFLRVSPVFLQPTFGD